MKAPEARHLAAWVSGLLLAATLALAGCRTTTSDKDIVTVSYDRFRQLAQADDDEPVLVLDVRSAQAYQQGHIPGGINIPMPELDRRDPRLTNASRIIVYGPGPESPLSPAATKKLIAMGYRHVLDFRGGLQTWRERGGEIAQSTRQAAE